MRGKLVIVGMLLVALAAAGFAWWWNYQRAARARAFWGPAAATIRSSTEVTALVLCETGSESGTPILWAGQELPVCRTAAISDARGMLHARTSLLVDESFDWTAPGGIGGDAPAWSHAVRFATSTSTVTLLFDFERRKLAWAESGQSVDLTPKTAKGWQDYLEKRTFGNRRTKT